MYKFWGKVRRANLRGKKLGFPTANINLTKNIPEGIYISKAKVGELVHPSVTFIGAAKTFNETKFHAEVYLLDFDENLYNLWITVTLIKKIRDNKKFNSAKQLVAKMKKDEKIAREYFKKKFS